MHMHGSSSRARATCLVFLWSFLPWHRCASALHQRSEKAEDDPPLRIVGGQDLPVDLTQKLWEGIDLTDGEYARLLQDDGLGEARAAAAKEDESRAGRGLLKVQILGPHDSGTHLFETALMMNWPKIASHKPRPAVYKHSLSSAKDICERYSALNAGYNFTIVAILRSPISQVTSWHKAPYALAPCTERNYSEMGEPCFANLKPDWNCMKDMWHKALWDKEIWEHTKGRSNEFQNSMAVYNSYVKQYQQMRVEPECQGLNVLLVHYEDMVFTPGKVAKEIAKMSGWPMPDSVKIMDQPAKITGAPVGREVAMKKISSRSYAAGVAPADMRSLCKELDADLIRDHFEKSFMKAPISYLKDCQAFS